MSPRIDWHAANQRFLVAAMAGIRAALERCAAPDRPQGAGSPVTVLAPTPFAEDTATPAFPPALERMRRIFGLSAFERDLLLLCAAVEFDAAFAPLCAAAQGDAARPYPTFSLALAALPGGHWSALAPTGPLRHWRLIDVGAANSLTLAPLRIDERVLHYLAGVDHADERLAALLDTADSAADLVPSQQALAEQVAAAWEGASRREPPPVVQLCGSDTAAKRAVAAAAAVQVGLDLTVLAAGCLPGNATELASLIRLWDRESALTGAALLVDCDEIDGADPQRVATAVRLVERARGLLLVSSRERLRLVRRPTVALDVGKPAAGEQRGVWVAALGGAAERLNGQIDVLVSQFDLNAPAIRAASVEGLARASDTKTLAEALWDSSRVQARPRLDDLAQRVEPAARWDDLVLPEPQKGILRDIAIHV
ncbi:MAG TPA: ATP-binding protein, partial [Chloroflexota bacterium]|nr:ATP-binding protein [Chloroflexota bacterium]